MSDEAGIWKYGIAAIYTMMAEFALLENLLVYLTLHPTKSPPNNNKRPYAPSVLSKKSATVDCRTIAHGGPQRSLYTKSETTSPTVSSDALMLSIVIDAYDGSDVATAGVTGAYLQAKMDGVVIMKFSCRYIM
jgi:hypothetical protein